MSLTRQLDQNYSIRNARQLTMKQLSFLNLTADRWRVMCGHVHGRNTNQGASRDVEGPFSELGEAKLI